MQIQQFPERLKVVISEDEQLEIAQVRTLEEAGYDRRPWGLLIEFVSGGAMYVHFVPARRPGGTPNTAPHYSVNPTEEL